MLRLALPSSWVSMTALTPKGRQILSLSWPAGTPFRPARTYVLQFFALRQGDFSWIKTAAYAFGENFLRESLLGRIVFQRGQQPAGKPLALVMASSSCLSGLL